MDRLQAVISRPDVRLVTLTGPGGVGKTRLSLAAAAALDHAFPHGVFFLALAAVRDADVMWKTLADDLDVDGDGQAGCWSTCGTGGCCWCSTTSSSSTGPARSSPRWPLRLPAW